MGVATTLHEGTRALHREAERAGVMGELLRGRATREAYLRLLAALHAIYEALDAALAAEAGHPLLDAMHEPGFARHAALAHDLAGAAGTAWRERVPVAAEAQAYAAHLRSLTGPEAPRLLAHAWLRYLGDLNGGQVLARIVRGAPGLAGIPTTFYEFPALPDPRATGAAWRARLESLPVAPALEAALLAEAIDGFQRHLRLFETLGPQDDATPSSSAA